MADGFVLDCSVTMAWCFEDEGDPGSDAVLDRLGEVDAVVPALWPLEVANVLLVAERRGRLTASDSSRFTALLGALPISVDRGLDAPVVPGLLAVAREYGLTAYDAAYLELAMRLGLPLATRDSELMGAARRAGVALV